MKIKFVGKVIKFLENNEGFRGSLLDAALAAAEIQASDKTRAKYGRKLFGIGKDKADLLFCRSWHVSWTDPALKEEPLSWGFTSPHMESNVGRSTMIRVLKRVEKHGTTGIPYLTPIYYHGEFWASMWPQLPTLIGLHGKDWRKTSGYRTPKHGQRHQPDR